MTVDQIVDDVVRLYKEGGDWAGYLQTIVEQVQRGEIVVDNKKVAK